MEDFLRKAKAADDASGVTGGKKVTCSGSC